MATLVSLPGIERAVEATLVALKAGRSVALGGQFGAGKTTALALLESELTRGGHRVAHVGLTRDDDAAPVALTRTAAALAPATEFETTFRDPSVPFAAKLRAVTRAFGDGDVLLFDEPQLGQSRTLEPTIFEERRRELSQAFLGVPCLKVFATGPSEAPRGFDSIAIEGASVPAEILSPGRWNGLAEHASRLLAADDGTLERYSPVELRLAVAAVYAGERPDRIVTEHLRRRELLGALLSKIQDDSKLKRVIGRLAVLRGAFDEQLLGQEIRDAHLTLLSAAILRQAILFGELDQRRLPEFVAYEARQREWLTPQERVEAHRNAASFRERRFQAARSFQDRVAEELEATHHLTEAGDRSLLESKRLYFAEQYDALGRACSLLGRALGERSRFEDAVMAYDRAIQLQPGDWYAHHYLAFNLDVLGREPGRVQQHYEVAVSQYEQHLWLHCRLICFLVTMGRMAEARKRWAEALERLIPRGGSDDAHTYQELHRPVAQVALYFGQLDFAERVLEDVPPGLRMYGWHAPLKRLLVLQREAERDEVVFPPGLDPELRWKGPHNLPEVERRHVVAWSPGRISHIDDEVHLRVAVLEGTTVRYGWRHIGIREFRRLASLHKKVEVSPAGTFVELVTLRRRNDRAEELILAYDRLRSLVSAPESLFPSPERYLQAAVASPQP